MEKEQWNYSKINNRKKTNHPPSPAEGILILTYSSEDNYSQQDKRLTLSRADVIIGNIQNLPIGGAGVTMCNIH